MEDHPAPSTSWDGSLNQHRKLADMMRNDGVVDLESTHLTQIGSSEVHARGGKTFFTRRGEFSLPLAERKPEVGFHLESTQCHDLSLCITTSSLVLVVDGMF